MQEKLFSTEKLDMDLHACHSNYGWKCKIVQANLGTKQDSVSKISKGKMVRGWLKQ
jgi:hypothetical protein